MARVSLVDLVEGKRSLLLGNLDATDPGPCAVRYRVHAIGLNRADLLYLDGEHCVPSHYPSRIGLEACGIVLVTAASSSAGPGGMKLGKLTGARAIATTRTGDKRERLLDEGADYVIATDEESLAERMREITDGRGVDIAYDPVAGPFIRTYLDGMADGAKVFVYGMLGGDPSIEYPIASVLRRGISIQPYSAIPALAAAKFHEEAKLFRTLAMQAGRLAPAIDRVFPLDDMIAAYAHMHSGKQSGKIVMKT